MNPVALVTGASRGIGQGIAIALAQIGYDVAINYARQRAAAEQTAQSARIAAKKRGFVVQTVVLQADVSNRRDRSRMLARMQTAFGRVDLLVNNAGVAPVVRQDLLQTSEESLDRLWRINVKGPFFLTQQVASWMARQQAHGKRLRAGGVRPKIIFISSLSAYTASINRGEYCISKAAVSMLTPLFATRLAADDIGVFEIRPGLIRTDMTAAVKKRYDRLIRGGLTPIARWGTPEDVGRAVAGLAQEMLPFSTGDVLNVDGGFHIRRL